MLIFAFVILLFVCVFVFKQKTAYEMRISDWSSDVCSSDLVLLDPDPHALWPVARPDRRQRQVADRGCPQVGLSGVRRIGPGDEGSPSAILEKAPDCEGQEADVGVDYAAVEPFELREAGDEAHIHRAARGAAREPGVARSEEHTSELQSLMRISYA